MSTCKTATPRPRRPSKIESRKLNTMFLTTFPRKLTKAFFEILPVRWEKRLWMWTQLVKSGQNRYFRGKLNNLHLIPARELIFSLKYSSWNVLTGNKHHRSGKNLYVDKNDLKLTKNRFSGYGILTTFRQLHFSTTNIEKIYEKVYIGKYWIESRA